MKRSPAAALWLSLLPGAGHVYIGQASKGLILVVLAWLSIHIADRIPLLIPFLWLFAMIDAYRGAQELNQLVETGRKPEPTMSFALNKWWGWGLIAIGVVFALENFGIDLDFIWDLWPLALIGLGIYILRAPTPTTPAKHEPPLPPGSSPDAPSEPVAGTSTAQEDVEAS